MFVSTKLIVSVAILLVVGETTCADYDPSDYCKLVRENTKLGSIVDCETYYVCQDGEAVQQKCNKEFSYDKNSQSCLPSSQVKCYYGVDNPCQGVNGNGFVPQQDSCTGFIYCEEGAEAGRGHCPGGTIFRDGECRNEECDVNEEAGPQLKSVCEIMPNNLFFGSTADCKQYQICIGGDLNSGECAAPYVFDIQNEKCNYKSGSMCSHVTGENDQEGKPQPCEEKEEGKVRPDENNCNKYYKCKSEIWEVLKCNAGQYFDTITEECKARQAATPAKSCDRCKDSKNPFVNAVDAKCQKYIICNNGVKSNEGACPNGEQFFDEKAQACLSDKIGEEKKKYAKSNGACYTESENSPEESTEESSEESTENPPQGSTEESTEETTEESAETTK